MIEKKVLYLIEITRDEKDVIAAELPNVHIVRTMKQKSHRGRYYMEEAPAAMRKLYSMRGIQMPKRKGRR
jgi:hypothetical protein